MQMSGKKHLYKQAFMEQQKQTETKEVTIPSGLYTTVNKGISTTTGSHGSSFGVQTGNTKTHTIQQNQRTHTVNTAQNIPRVLGAGGTKVVYQNFVEPHLPPSVQAAVHSTVGYVRGVLNQPASAVQNQGQYQGGSGVQPHIYYGTNPNTGETKRFDLGKGTLNLQTRQALTEAGWTNISQQPPQTPPDSSYTWSQSQNTFVRKNTTQVQSQGGGWDSWLPW